MTANYLKSIDTTKTLLDAYVKLRVSAIKSFDNYAHTMMDSYAKMLAQFNET